MRALILVASLLVVGSGASAQSQSSSRPALGFQAARVETENQSHLDGGGDHYECLVRKKDGKRECHTRAEWRQIAVQIASADSRSR